MLRIQTQTVLLSVVPLTFLVMLLLLASVLQQKTEETAAWAQRSTNAFNELDAVQKTLADGNRAVVEYTRHPSAATLGPYRAGLRDMAQHVARLEALASDDAAQHQRATRYGKDSIAVYSLLSQYLSLWQAGKKTEAQREATQPAVRALVNDWENARNDFGTRERQKTLARYTALHRDVSTIGMLLIGASLLGIVLTLFITARFGLRIARRLLQLAQNARQLGRGEEASEIAGADEIAELDDVYREMTQRLRETLHQKEEAIAAFERAQHVATTLQRALLPQDLPHVAGVAFDGLYSPGTAEAQIGGDWYDALTLGDGRILITIGDVAGSGLQAAVIMASMRQVIRGVAQVYADPATMVDAADRTLKAEHPDSLVTAFVAVFDPVVQVLSYCSAGHPPPLVRRAAGTIAELPARGLPLGLRNRGDAETRTIDIPNGSTLVFYTDGLIESTQDLIEGDRRLRAALADARVIERTDLAQALHDVVLHDGARDDVAILAMRVGVGAQPTTADRLQRWSFDTADVVTAQHARGVCASVLAAGGMFPDDVFTAELIFGELLSNAVRYAPGAIDVVLDPSGSSPVLHFLDRGPGFVLIPRLPTDLLSERGRGLFLVWSLSEDFNVTKRTDGGAHARVVLLRKSRRPGVAKAVAPPEQSPVRA